MDTLSATLATIERLGLLLLHDQALPCLVHLVAGEPVRGSWWGHREGPAIYAIATALEAHPDVLVSKLVHGKVTFVHRRLAPAVAAVGSARAAWQLEGLTEPALRLLAAVDAAEGLPVRATGEPAKLLERRLLAFARQVHTAGGKHATELVAWSTLVAERELAPLPSEPDARRALEAAAARLGAAARLPW
ncbi:MAG: hypothetical protein IT385_23230 [Deltaproteobacteria bacterium]|nr:hypothetical protein [Deltaproteobacteria bacterium]